MRMTAIVVAVAAIGAGTLLTTTASAQSKSAAAEPPTEQTSLVEDYQHPNKEGAAAIGMTLNKGNGKIFWVDCASATDLLTIESDSITTPNNQACFKITGPDGYLSMSIPSTYFVKGDSHKVKAKLTAVVNGAEVTHDYDIKSGQYTPVGETVHPDEGPAALVELRSVS